MRTAIVTGASGGVGRGIALELARAGYGVAVNYHGGAERAEETVAEARGLGVDALAIRADVGQPGDVTRMVAEVGDRFGRLDVFVNNAGVQTWTPLLDVTEAEWDRSSTPTSRAVSSARRPPRDT